MWSMHGRMLQLQGGRMRRTKHRSWIKMEVPACCCLQDCQIYSSVAHPRYEA